MKINISLSTLRRDNYTFIDGPWPIGVGQTVFRDNLYTVAFISEERDQVTLER